MMKKFLAVGAAAVAVFASGLLGTGLAWSAVTSGDDPLPKPTFEVNANGETYGISLNADEDPVLMAAYGVNGEFGYIRAADLNGPSFDTIEETLRYQDEHLMEAREIPLYASDGKTVVGTFIVDAPVVSTEIPSEE